MLWRQRAFVSRPLTSPRSFAVGIFLHSLPRSSFKAHQQQQNATKVCLILLSLGTMIALKTIANRAFSSQRGLSSNTTGVAPRVAPTSTTSRRVQCRPVSFQDNVQAAVATSNQQNVATAAAPSGRALRMPTIELITAAVSIQAQTQQFERFAGRSAMVSVYTSALRAASATVMSEVQGWWLSCCLAVTGSLPHLDLQCSYSPCVLYQVSIVFYV